MDAKELSPLQARTERQILSLRTDNTTAGDFWMLTDGLNVTVCAQKMGRSPTATITIPRAEFNRLVNWYTKPQKATP